MCENPAVTDLISAPKKALITGITGQDGTHLVEADLRNAGLDLGKYLNPTALEPGS
jgi:hypothetical protein